MEHVDLRNRGPVIVHTGGSISFASDSAAVLLGGDAAESLRGRSLSALFAPADATALEDQLEALAAGDAEALGLTVELPAQETEPREAVLLNSPITWDGEEQILTRIFDVDSHLPTGLSADTIGSAPIGICIADARQDDLPLIFANDQFIEMTGYTREEVLGKNCRFLQGEDTRQDAVDAVRKGIDDRRPVTVELRNYRKDGSMFWNELTVIPVCDPEDELTHFLGFQVDITAEKAFEQEKRLFEMQADSVDKAIFITDAEGIIQYVNQQFELTTGYSAAEAIGNDPSILKSGEQDQLFYKTLWETIKAGEVWESEITNKRKTGERYQVNQKIVPITDSGGELTHFVAIEEDATDSRFLEEVLEVMSRVLRHNVRTSVQAIDGYAAMLEEEELDEDRRAALGQIREHVMELEKVSDRAREVRELFRSRRDQAPLSVDDIAAMVLEQRAYYPRATIEVTTRTDGDVEVPNGSLLLLAIDEAIENGVVHNDSEQPTVTVTIRQLTSSTDLIIEVVDNGPGIPDYEWDVVGSGRETPLNHGSSIGLWLIYWTITGLGGTVRRIEDSAVGNVLLFRIPTGRLAHVEGWNPD